MVETGEAQTSVDGAEARPATRHRREVLAIGGGTALLAVLGAVLVYRADHRVNHVPAGGEPRPVSVVAAAATSYRDSRSYVGAVEPWIEASVGPQYISAYVKSVLVRPGDAVAQGQLLATLDCSNPTAVRRATEMQAQAADERHRATANEAARQTTLLDGGFIAPNDVEQKSAQSAAESARFLETRAHVTSATLDVHDCALRSPFDGEIATRITDPGAFVRPGVTIVSVVDRRTVRIVADAPEKDFEASQVGTPVRVHMLSTGADVAAAVSRRAPKADSRARTVHFEIDIADSQRVPPTGTTALVQLDVGNPVVATTIPLSAATQQGGKAKLFIVEHGVARTHEARVLGEREGNLYFTPQGLPVDTQVVTEGRALLSDGDPVSAHVRPMRPESPDDAGAPDSGQEGPR